MTAILLSVRPGFARALVAGTKTAEVRRRFPDQPAGTDVFVYSSSPDRAVIGTVKLDSIDRPEVGDVWGLYQDQIHIAERPLLDYLDAVRSAAILRVSDATRWSRAVPLSDLRNCVGVEPPQSFRYLDALQAGTLRELAQAHGPMPLVNTTFVV